MRLTVAICTWNRAGLLARTLEGLASAAPPAAAWEVLVVDNGSADDTTRVLDRFTARLPLRRALEPALGLANARNTAVAEATGDYIVWTDDDVLVDPGWLCAYEDAIARWPDAAVFGGPIRPKFDGAPPPWLIAVWPMVAGAFAVRDLGDRPIPLDAHENVPYGANFAVRAREQRRFPYDPALGRRGGGGTLGEETAVIRSILSGGGAGWWVPDAGVSHLVPGDRQAIAYLRRYFTLVGRTYPKPEVPRPGRARALARVIRSECAYRLARMTGDPHRWIAALIEAATVRGGLTRRCDDALPPSARSRRSGR